MAGLMTSIVKSVERRCKSGTGNSDDRVLMRSVRQAKSNAMVETYLFRECSMVMEDFRDELESIFRVVSVKSAHTFSKDADYHNIL